mgnify:CR=1 FL=1
MIVGLVITLIWLFFCVVGSLFSSSSLRFNPNTNDFEYW